MKLAACITTGWGMGTHTPHANGRKEVVHDLLEFGEYFFETFDFQSVSEKGKKVFKKTAIMRGKARLA